MVAAMGIVALQALIAFHQVAAMMTRGHNGWNSAAYQLAARNTLRWKLLFPLQYYTGTSDPGSSVVYTHHPLGMHLHNVAAMWLFGDHESSIRIVAATHAVLAIAALIFVVWKLWNPPTGLLAGAFYVLLPIVVIYTNMANHVSGYVFYTLLCFYSYLRYQQAARDGWSAQTRRWLLATLVAFVMAGIWDWPANYAALAIAAHWAGVMVVRAFRARRGPKSSASASRLWPQWACWVAFCITVLSVFFGHFALAHHFGGGVDELLRTAGERQGTIGRDFGDHLQLVPPLMFTVPVLVGTAAWFVVTLVLTCIGKGAAKNLIPFVFLIGGSIHYVVFKSSAVVHSFWAWHACPGVAIACAALVAWVVRGATQWPAIRERNMTHRALAGIIVGVSLLPLIVRNIEISPGARHVGGAMWFITNVRGPIQTYHSGLPGLRFAEQVREWTDRGTGVLVDRSIETTIPEPRWYTTLDREKRKVRRLPDALPDSLPRWVYVSLKSRINREQRAAYASKHPYYECGDFVMVDLRREAVDIRVYRLETQPADFRYAYLVSPYEGPYRWVRDSRVEAKLRREVKDRDEFRK